ncbi:unnamed protein product [Dibothriocephalus latus]|uniref:Small ribosomal subunit protein bS16m n=1 Tax=Dibothriocephalus latus TaxID=60516 RepID=A0A3P7L3M7_DIBLA|nr:unnamed protein product [Dibothriocephalus latus]
MSLFLKPILPSTFGSSLTPCSVRFLRKIAAARLRKLIATENEKTRDLIVPGPEKSSTWWAPIPTDPQKKIVGIRPVRPLPQLRIAMVREGCTNRPFYTIQVKYNQTHSKDQGIEQLGSWDPFPNNIYGEQLVGLNVNRIFFWMAQGAEPTKRVAELLGLAGVLPVHPHSYLVAHRARLALAKRLQENQEQEAKKATEVSEEAVLPSEEKEEASSPTKADSGGESDAEEDLLNRPDALWRRQRFAPTWWRHGLV